MLASGKLNSTPSQWSAGAVLFIGLAKKFGGAGGAVCVRFVCGGSGLCAGGAVCLLSCFERYLKQFR